MGAVGGYGAPGYGGAPQYGAPGSGPGGNSYYGANDSHSAQYAAAAPVSDTKGVDGGKAGGKEKKSNSNAWLAGAGGLAAGGLAGAVIANAMG